MHNKTNVSGGFIITYFIFENSCKECGEQFFHICCALNIIRLENERVLSAIE